MTDPASSPRARRRLRLTRAAAVLVVAVGTVLGGIGLAAPAGATARQYGQGPLDAIRAAAAADAACGLTADQLAAMMITPTYPETGGTVPSPMTLSRYDDNAALYAFGSRATSYLRAFWSPGVGMWQFDSAGGWNLTAATAIDAVTSAQQAASTISYRWCNAPSSKAADPVTRRQYAWGPWYACAVGTGCETIYNDLYNGTSLVVSAVAGVDRYGGMVQRSCDVPGLGTGLPCWYVDPANAQGSKGWTQWPYVPGSGSTPLTAPFYDVTANGREYRYWIDADTGYGTDVVASKPITADARTSLTWGSGNLLCDRTASRGACGVGPVNAGDIALLLRSSNTAGVADMGYGFSAPRGGKVLMCDWNGDGIDTPAEVLNGWWYLTNSSRGGPPTTVFPYGNPGDTPVCGDWDGDGRDEPGIVRGGWWYLAPSTGAPYATRIFPYGNPTDIPVVGDWNGDGRDEPGVVRGGWWYLAPSTGAPFATTIFPYGNPGDVPVAGSWSVGRRSTVGVVR